MKVLLIGCSGGIGTAIARRLNKSKYDVVGVDIEQPQKNLVSRFYKADLGSEGQILSLCKKLNKNEGSLWAIIYCAGIYPIVDWNKYDIKLWDKVNGINVKAAFIMLTKLERLIEDGGRIVTIVSGTAHAGSRDLGYSASKAALLGLTKSLAMNFAKRKISVNAVCPGVIDTPMSQRMPAERKAKHEKNILLGRIGDPDEVAISVEYLLDKDNAYMTGATIDVNGGLYLR